MVNHNDRIARLEAIVGMPPDDGFSDLITRSMEQQQQIQQLQQSTTTLPDHQGAGPSSSPEGQQDGPNTILDEMLNRMRELTEEVDALKRERARQPYAVPHPSQIRVPEPKPFSGARNAKELENFVWDTEEYFLAMEIPEARRIRLASAFLAGDAKLWWRTRSAEDRNAGRPGITTWESFMCLYFTVSGTFETMLYASNVHMYFLFLSIRASPVTLLCGFYWLIYFIIT